MLKPQAFCVQNKHFSNKLRSHLHYQFSCFDTKYSCCDSYLRSEILDNIFRFAIAKWGCISKSMKKKIKFIFFRILSLDFSSYTSYDFLISKERTPNSQKSARISIYSKLISDSVTWVPGQFRMGECHPLLKINRCLGTHGTCT